jgi:transcriptional regulator with XRE-family HTH domain
MTSLVPTHDLLTTRRSIAAWLVRLRSELELSQKVVANAAGVTRGAISRWERGITGPTLVQAERIRVFERNLRRARGLR